MARYRVTICPKCGFYKTSKGIWAIITENQKEAIIRMGDEVAHTKELCPDCRELKKGR